jgi:hypothetical protein
MLPYVNEFTVEAIFFETSREAQEMGIFAIREVRGPPKARAVSPKGRFR